MFDVLAAALIASAVAGDKPAPSEGAAAVRDSYDNVRAHAGGLLINGAFLGARVGLEFPVLLGVRDRKPKRKDFRKHGIGEFVVRPTVGGWIEPRNANNFFVGAEGGTRWTTHRGFRIAGYLGANYLHAFNGGMTYNATEPGDVRGAALAGSPGFLGMASMGLGMDWKKRKQNPLSIEARAGLWLQAPFNNFILPGAILELDVGWRLIP